MKKQHLPACVSGHLYIMQTQQGQTSTPYGTRASMKSHAGMSLMAGLMYKVSDNWVITSKHDLKDRKGMNSTSLAFEIN